MITLLLLLSVAFLPTATRSDPLCPRSDEKDDGSERQGGNNHLGRTLNVHIVPHTHDDVGWLKTVDQYFYGLNNTIQQAHVALILDNVLSELQDPYTSHNRTFVYVEMKFFSMWYMSLPSPKKNALKQLIEQEQFSFANGGWCMHDEATTHYMGMIDQTTLGHTFLMKELGVTPKVGWQIDPFGHSGTQGGLLTSSVGFDALYFGRIHYVDLQNRHAAAECEGLWKSSPDNSSVFWGLTGSYGGNYGAPEGFCFDSLCADDPLIGLEPNRLKERIKLFANAVGVQANRTKGRNIMMTMGMDFQYSQARKNFMNLDALIDATRQLLGNGEIQLSEFLGDRFDNVNIFYSTPERYTQCKYADFDNSKRSEEEGSTLDKYNPAKWVTSPKTKDWFPYADCDHCYWSGYFSSRQGLKRMERVGSSFLHAARQIESLSRIRLTKKNRIPSSTHAWNASPFYDLDDAMGVIQHHDGVSGTSKQHVAYDYAKRIASGMANANAVVTDMLRQLLVKSNEDALRNLNYCNTLKNETICTVSQEASMIDSGKDIYIIVYNALALMRDEVVSIPINSTSYYDVQKLGGGDLDWVQVKSSTIPNSNYVQVQGAASGTLYFEADGLPPLGISVFRATRGKDTALPLLSTSTAPRNLRQSNEGNMADEIVITNDILSVTLDRVTGVITSIRHILDDFAVKVDQQYGYYKSSFNDKSPASYHEKNVKNFKGNGQCLPGYTDNEGNESPWLIGSAETWQNSGAYIFRPEPDQKLHNIAPHRTQSVVVYNSGPVKEVHSSFGQGGWIKQIARLLPGKDFVEIEYVVGPVPIHDGGKEVVSKWSTSIASGGHFFTDSNGREFQKRKRGDYNLFGHQPNSYEPVAGNYYPVNAAIFIEDDAYSFGCVVDRSQGGTSLSDGAIELMIQRRTLFDDARGVGEPLNETDVGITPNQPFGNAERLGEGVIVKGHHRLLIGRGGNGAKMARGLMDRVFSEPHIFVASMPSGSSVPFRRHAPLSLLQSSLPDNIMVISFLALDAQDTFLLRLGHQYGVNEDATLSKPVKIDLHKLFAKNDVVSIREKTLSANQMRSDWEARRLQWDLYSTEEWTPADDGLIILKPLEIRTFEIVLS